MALQERLNSTPPEKAVKALEAFQQLLMADFDDKFGLLKRNIDPTPITLADVPDRLKQRFVGKSGRYLLRIYERKTYGTVNRWRPL